jgi:hypothetical protein
MTTKKPKLKKRADIEAALDRLLHDSYRYQRAYYAAKKKFPGCIVFGKNDYLRMRAQTHALLWVLGCRDTWGGLQYPGPEFCTVSGHELYKNKKNVPRTQAPTEIPTKDRLQLVKS